MPSRRRSWGSLGRHQLGDVEAGDPHVAAGGPLLGVHQLEDGGLAGAGVTGEEDELTLRDVEGDVLEGQRAIGVGLEDVGEADHAGKIGGSATGESGGRALPQRLLQVGDEVLGVLDPAAEPQEAIGDALAGPLLLGERAVTR